MKDTKAWAIVEVGNPNFATYADPEQAELIAAALNEAGECELFSVVPVVIVSAERYAEMTGGTE